MDIDIKKAIIGSGKNLKSVQQHVSDITFIEEINELKETVCHNVQGTIKLTDEQVKPISMVSEPLKKSETSPPIEKSDIPLIIEKSQLPQKTETSPTLEKPETSDTLPKNLSESFLVETEITSKKCGVTLDLGDIAIENGLKPLPEVITEFIAGNTEKNMADEFNDLFPTEKQSFKDVGEKSIIERSDIQSLSQNPNELICEVDSVDIVKTYNEPDNETSITEKILELIKKDIKANHIVKDVDVGRVEDVSVPNTKPVTIEPQIPEDVSLPNEKPVAIDPRILVDVSVPNTKPVTIEPQIPEDVSLPNEKPVAIDPRIPEDVSLPNEKPVAIDPRIPEDVSVPNTKPVVIEPRIPEDVSLPNEKPVAIEPRIPEDVSLPNTKPVAIEPQISEDVSLPNTKPVAIEQGISEDFYVRLVDVEQVKSVADNDNFELKPVSGDINLQQPEDNSGVDIKRGYKLADKKGEEGEIVSENSIINTLPIKEELKPQTNLSFNMGQESFASVLEGKNTEKELKETDIELEEDLSILSTDAENKAMAGIGAKSDEVKLKILKDVRVHDTKPDAIEPRIPEDVSVHDTKPVAIEPQIPEDVSVHDTKPDAIEPQIPEDVSLPNTKPDAIEPRIPENVMGSHQNEKTALPKIKSVNVVPLQEQLSSETNKRIQVEKKSILNIQTKKDYAPTDDTAYTETVTKVKENTVKIVDSKNKTVKQDTEIIIREDVKEVQKPVASVVTKQTPKSDISPVLEKPYKSEKLELSQAGNINKEEKINLIADIADKSGIIPKSVVLEEHAVKVNTQKMPIADANLVLSLNKNDSINLAEALTKDNTQPQYQQLSEKMAELLKKSIEENRPLRLDFDNKVSVIIKISKEGKISADFIPGDRAVEEYLRNNLPLLKVKFNDENIKYDDLTHRNARQQKENRKNNKEQDHE